MKRKRFLCLLLGLVLALSLAACAEDSAEPSGSTGPASGNVDFTSFSKGFDEKGHFAGVKASDYVKLPAYEDVTVPEFAHITSDRVIADGDFVNIDYVGSIDGVAFDGGSTQGKGTDIVVGYTSYIDDFIEQLKGHAPGETFDIEVTFPENYGNEDLNGKDAVFNITVNFIWDVTEEKAKAIGFTDLAAMSQYVAGGYSVGQVTTGVELNVFATSSEVDNIPDSVLSTVRELISTTVTAEAARYTAAYGMDLNTYLLYVHGASSLDALLDAQTRPTAEMYMIFQAVAEQEGIAPTDEDIAAEELTEYVDIYGKPYIMFSLIQQKVSALITEKLTGETE